MRTATAIRRQVTHFRSGCTSDDPTREYWIAALEWVLAENELLQPKPEQSAFAELVTAGLAARHALRSYQFGNSSPELACEIADELDTAIRHSLEEREDVISETSGRLSELIRELQQAIDEIRVAIQGGTDVPSLRE